MPRESPPDTLPRDEAVYERLKARLEARAEAFRTPETALPYILGEDTRSWWHPESLATFAVFRDDPIAWASIKTQAQKCQVFPRDLERAVDHYISAQEAREAARAPEDGPGERTAPAPALLITCMADVVRQDIDWLWYPYFAYGKLSILDGDPGVGKSMLALQIAASLSRGYPLPDQGGVLRSSRAPARTTLLLALEDDLADTMKDRLTRADADQTKVSVLLGERAEDGTIRRFSFQDMPLLERAIAAVGASLVVIDPIQAYIGSKIDMSRANQTRPLLDALAQVAEDTHTAMLCIRHLTKPGAQGGNALYRGQGGMDMIGAARSGTHVAQHPLDPTRVLFYHFKSNGAKLGRTQVFSKAEGRFMWCGISRLDSETITGSAFGPERLQLLRCACWLEARLASGLPVTSKTIEKEADDEGYKHTTLWAAKKAIGAQQQRHQEGKDAYHEWFLPPLEAVHHTTSTMHSTDTSTTMYISQTTDTTDTTDTPYTS